MLKGSVKHFGEFFQQGIHIFKLTNILRIIVQCLLIILEHTYIIDYPAKFLCKFHLSLTIIVRTVCPCHSLEQVMVTQRTV